jgi:hypothetical protein
MTLSKTNQPKPLWSRFRFLPYGVLGLLIFYFNSTWDSNIFVKGYLTLIETQTSIILLYFLMARLSKSQQRKIDL